MHVTVKEDNPKLSAKNVLTILETGRERLLAIADEISAIDEKTKQERKMTYRDGSMDGVKEMQSNLIRCSRTEVIDEKIQLIVTEDRIKTIVDEMKKQMEEE